MAESIVNDIDISLASTARIKVIGVGGGGGNAVQKMIMSGLRGVQFVCANTDLQALNKNDAPTKVQLGEKLTKGLGAGAVPAVGCEAAVESKSAIRDILGDADMVFVTAGMGGGTGTGAAPVVAQIAKELGALTVGVVTKPFSFEGVKRMRAAEEGLAKLQEHVDCLITVPNDRLVAFAPKKASFAAMLQKANDVLYYAVKGISDVILGEGLINLDFADVRTTMSEAGLALMGTGIASGENRAREATQRAIMSPLLEDVSLESAKAVLYNITASMDITAEEIAEIGNIIDEATPADANIIFGVIFDENVGEEIRITVIATGIESQMARPETPPKVTIFPLQAARGAGTGPTRHPKPHGQGFLPRGASAQKQDPKDEPENGTQPSSPRRAQIERWIDDSKGNIPPYLVKKNDQGVTPRRQHKPGYEDFIFDDDDFEIPTFIRMQAD
ncbi:MAG: cell division protein FtsZ [Desulfovibrio sp.]|jgi:cell division protein FtsZ|nr:cell division protein FtsZ [Desulfovibrio sp.]